MKQYNNTMQGFLAFTDGFDGSAISYTINYTDLTSGVVCASKSILASSCVKEICEDNFRVSTTFCKSSSHITVTIWGMNVLGKGLPSSPLSITGIIIYYDFGLLIIIILLAIHSNNCLIKIVSHNF